MERETYIDLIHSEALFEVIGYILLGDRIEKNEIRYTNFILQIGSGQ